MKLKTLKITNIASIEEAIISFDKEPLASDPLFLITGDTGSGKSTILNCICLALYHTTPNLDAYGNAKEKTFDGLGTNSAVQMMRRGCNDASVELTFEANNGNVYRSCWGVHKRRMRGTVQNYDTPVLLECLQTSNPNVQLEPTLTRIGEIDNRIPELVGFNLDQFTRTTLLAQGQFSKFLYAEADEKTSILEKLTGTEVFTLIGIEINRLKGEAQVAHDALKEKIKTIHLLTEDEKGQLSKEIAEAKEEQVRLNNSIKELSAQTQWIKNKELKEQELRQKQNQLQHVQNFVSSDEFIQAQKMLQRWDYTHSVRNLMDIQKQQRQQYLTYREQILGLQQRYDTLIEGLRFLEEALSRSQKEHAHIEELLHQQRPNETMYQSAGEISRLSQSLQLRKKQISQLQNDLEAQRIYLEKSQKQELLLNEAATKASDAFEQQKLATQAQQELCKDIDLSSLTKKVNELNGFGLQLQQAIRDIEDYRQKLSDQQLALKELDAAKKEIEIYTQSLAQAQEKLPSFEALYNQSYAQFLGSLALSEHLILVREYYSSHQQCPLCGTKGVSLYSDQQLEDNKRLAQEALQKTQQELERLKEEINRLKAQLKVHNKNAKAKEADYQNRLQLLEKAKRKVTSVSQTLSFDYDDVEAISKLQQRILKTNEEETLKKIELQKALELQKKLDIQNQFLERARSEKEKAEKAFQNQREHTRDLQSKLFNTTNLLEQTQKEAEATLNAAKERIILPQGYDEVSYENLASLSQYITRQAQLYNDYQRKAESLTRQKDSIKVELENCHKSLEKLSVRYTMPQSVIPRQITNLNDAILQLGTLVNNLEGKMDQANEQAQKAQDEVCQWLQQNPSYTEPSLLELQMITESKAASLRQKISETQRQLAEAEAAYKTIEAELNDLRSKRPQIQQSIIMEIIKQNGLELEVMEDHNLNDEVINDEVINEDTENSPHGNEFESVISDHQSENADGKTGANNTLDTFSLVDLLSKEILENSVTQLEQTLENISRLIAQNEFKLKNDEEQIRKIAKDMELLASREKALENWKLLSSKFGGADGKAFRKIAQSYVLRLLLQQANYYLNKLSARYELSCEDGSLTINIIDKFQSGNIRNVKSLSGGESFVVSLALALGLSAINPQKINVDILFIDEGFGTLDKEILDTVITSLDQLHMINGRRIGLISHVDTLKERIQTQIQVTRSGASSSKIKIVPEPSQK